MSGVSIMWTPQGMIMADVIGETSEAYELENPVYVNLTQQGAQLYPFLALVTEEKTTEIRKSDIMFNAKIAEPFKELRNAYTEMFGGIQLLTK